MIRLALIATPALKYVLVALAIGGQSRGQDLEITSFGSNGQLMWTNSVSNAKYRVEWAPSLHSDWRTNNPFADMQSTSSVTIIEVPVHFRVVWLDPSFRLHGTVYYSTNPLSGYPVELWEDGDPPTNLLATVYSQANGEYSIENIPPGDYWYGPGSQNGYGGWRGGPLSVTDSDIHRDVDVHRLFSTTSPLDGSTVHTNTPAFEWGTFPEFDVFQFQLYHDADGLVESVDDLPNQSYTITVELLDGQSYWWIIHASDSAGNFVGLAYGGYFTVELN